MQSVFDNTYEGIDCCNHTWKAYLTDPLDCEGVQGVLGNWLLYSDMKNISDIPP